jgi:hypothetical protein
MTSTESRASFGEHGPGETTICSGASARIAQTVLRAQIALRTWPVTPAKASGTSSHTSTRAGSTGPGSARRPIGTRLTVRNLDSAPGRTQVAVLEGSAMLEPSAVFEFEGEKYDWEYTLDDAKRTGDACKGDGTLKTMWAKRPEDMLWARLVSRSVRRLAPEICAGLYTPEEVADMHKTETVALTQDEIIARAKIVEPIAEPITEMPENYDCNVCPAGYGKWSGKPWDDMPAHILHSALDSNRLDIDMENAIIRVLEARGEA